MPEETNRVFEIVKYPEGETPDRDCFELQEEPIPELTDDGQVLVRALYLRMDPGSRSKMIPPEDSPYDDSWAGTESVSSGGIGEVVESTHPDYSVGDIVSGRHRWADYDVLTDDDDLKAVDLDTAPIRTTLHVLGHTGRVAYVGLTEIADLQEGETVVVSSAAGSVGSIASQIAKIYDCRVIGIAGTDDKIDYLVNELGIDEGINYKTTDDIQEDLAELCHDSVDVYFDNVGGEISDAVMNEMNTHGRIVQCGRIALINAEGGDRPTGPRHEGLYIKKRLRREGFVVDDHEELYPEAESKLEEWYTNDRLQHRETIVEGLENTPDAFVGLFEGDDLGKTLVEVSEPPDERDGEAPSE